MLNEINGVQRETEWSLSYVGKISSSCRQEGWILVTRGEMGEWRNGSQETRHYFQGTNIKKAFRTDDRDRE